MTYLRIAGRAIDATLTYVDDATGNKVSRRWNETPEHTRNQTGVLFTPARWWSFTPALTSDAMIERYNKIKDRRTGVCSYGEKRSMVVCGTLTFGHDKQLFILDEPTAGVDAQHRHLIWRLIKDMQSEDKAFVVSSHLIDEISKNTDSFFLLNNHSAQMFSSTEQLITEYGGSSSEEAFVNATVSTL